jgi:hypothetical protein
VYCYQNIEAAVKVAVAAVDKVAIVSLVVDDIVVVPWN